VKFKAKAKVKNNQLILKTKISSDEVINERDLNILSSSSIRGILKPNLKRKKLLEYTGPSGIPINERLKKPVTKYEFFYIMFQIVEATKKVRNNNLFLNNLILNLQYVYINENTREMQFIYLPILSNHLQLDVIGFMTAIAYLAKPAETNTDHIARYVQFIKSLEVYDIRAIERFISQEDKDLARQIMKQNVGQSGFITPNRQEFIEHYQQKAFDEPTSLLQQNQLGNFVYEDEATGLLADEDEATGLLDDTEEATGLLTNEEDGTALLEENAVINENIHYPSLVRVSTNETISLNKPVFRLGKERSYVDYFVSNNNAISRSHADIITRGNRYFVYDQNSTNHTYINDELVSAKVETEIFDGNILRLANEEFIFHI